MLKFLSEIKGANVLLFQERAVVSVVLDYLFNAETGKMMAIYVKDPRDKKQKVILASDVKAIGQDFILVDSLDSLTEIEEVVRLKEAAKINPKLIGEKVVTENGQKVGKVRDVTLNLTSFKIDKLYIAPAGKIQMLARELIVPAGKIVKIEKTKITIKDGSQKVKSGIFVPKTVTASN